MVFFDKLVDVSDIPFRWNFGRMNPDDGDALRRELSVPIVVRWKIVTAIDTPMSPEVQDNHMPVQFRQREWFGIDPLVNAAEFRRGNSQ